MKTLEKIRYKADFASMTHMRDLEKPNEDRLVCDEERGIFIVLDGVTRVHSEYEKNSLSSAARDVGDIFIKEVYAYICEHLSDPDPKAILLEAVKGANALIKEYRSKKSEAEWVYYPATLGIISFLREGRLHYLSVGDCIGVLLRESSKILFGREFTLEAVDLHGVNKKDRYAIYCNHPEHHLSYTVFNGDTAVMRGVEYSFIDIYGGDTLFLASDGIGSYLKYEKAADLKEQSPEEIFLLSGEYDSPPYAEYADDKTLIKITF